MPAKAQHFVFDKLPRESLFGGTYQRAAFRGDNSLVTVNWMDPAMPPQPLHSHDFDQVSMIVQGAMDFEVEGERFHVQAGEVLIIPANAKHTGIAVGDEVALNIDVFAPPREDYLHLVAHQDQSTGAILSSSDVATVHRLLADWSYLLDHGHGQNLLAYLTEDAVITGLGPDIVGHDGFLAWARAREEKNGRRTHHVVTNQRYLTAAEGTITGTASVSLYVADGDGDPQLQFVGEYDDVIVRTPDGLKFSRRDIRPM